jgi:hypothetical protein
MKHVLTALTFLIGLVAAPSAIAQSETFILKDHGFGSLGPNYGLRLDILDGSGDANIFSVSNLDGAYVTLTYTETSPTGGTVEIDGTVVRNSDNNTFQLNYVFEADRLGAPGDPFSGFRAVTDAGSGTLSGVGPGGSDFDFIGKSNGSYFNTLAFDGHRLPGDNSTGVFRGWVVDGDRPCCNDFLVQVVAVPEPATWLMMIVGFALTGFAVKRRRVAEIA